MIVKQIIETTGGEIAVESEGEDQGSRFIFNMPMSIYKEDISTTEITKFLIK